ncbi:MAG: hypothetical protein A3E26_04545 [Chlamydiae bacterium RIFCSPHIGHO2_12_FULL_49_32]|nr:MAG: hypothetical protein A3E26_04545 [Chlamydiae bacterium RIFCSPHIGHO2_12_FULL_49_32]
MPRYFHKSQEDLCKAGDLFLEVPGGQNLSIRRDSATVSDYFNSFGKPIYEITNMPMKPR